MILAQSGAETAEASSLMLWGAACFGALIGWYIYYINRRRKSDVQLGDLVTVIGAIGGAAVLKLFPAQTEIFGAYGIGLAAGFFGYFLALVIMVAVSPNFSVDWFLDTRCKLPEKGYGYTNGGTPMADQKNKGVR